MMGKKIDPNIAKTGLLPKRGTLGAALGHPIHGGRNVTCWVADDERLGRRLAGTRCASSVRPLLVSSAP